MARTLPNVPLWPRGGRSGRRAAAALSSIVGGPSSVPASTVPWASCAPNPSGRLSAIAILRCGRLDRVPDGVAAGRTAGTTPGVVREGPQALHPREDASLAVVQPLLDVDREDVAPAGRSDPEGDRDRVLGLMADRHRDALHPQLLRSPF